MPPLPKRKYPKSRQGKRRSHDKLKLGAIVDCPHCHNPRPAHHVCPTCGYYRGREEIQIEGPSLGGG